MGSLVIQLEICACGAQVGCQRVNNRNHFNPQATPAPAQLQQGSIAASLFWFLAGKGAAKRQPSARAHDDAQPGARAGVEHPNASVVAGA